MTDFEHRLEKHIDSHDNAMLAIGERLLKFETNHLAHMEADMRFLKEFAVRMERSMAEFSSELKKNSEDTHTVKLELTKSVGELNTKIATIETREGSNSGWLKSLIMVVVGGLIGAAITFFTKG